jgi:hypothetical protein
MAETVYNSPERAAEAARQAERDALVREARLAAARDELAAAEAYEAQAAAVLRAANERVAAANGRLAALAREES